MNFRLPSWSVPYMLLVLFLPLSSCSQQAATGARSGAAVSGPLTVLAFGDAGEDNSILRGNAMYAAEMMTGEHDAGRYQAMIFLGDNFNPVGLNVPSNDVGGTVSSILGHFDVPFRELGRPNVHAIPGEHDYYARTAVNRQILFGLFTISEFPVGLTDRGNLREAAVDLWTYHWHMPGEAVYPLQDGAADSAQFVFFDSSPLLRTEPSTWHPVLDSLRKLLVLSARRPGIVWRIFCTHHPLRSVGEHAGYTEWDTEGQQVEYLTPCNKDTNAPGWLRNWFDPEDLCADRYRAYVDSVEEAFLSAGVRIQLVLAAHDHSLQLLSDPGPAGARGSLPRVHLISGASSQVSRVKLPTPPLVFTSADPSPSRKGESQAGFAQLRFEGNRLRIEFFSARTGDLIDMGGGKKEFWVAESGSLLP